jgi:CRP-like cAMP-binding protein
MRILSKSGLQDANNLLSRLRPQDFAALEPYLTRVGAENGDILHAQGVNVKTAFFPLGATLVAFTIELEEGREIDAALIGREGAVGGIVSQGFLPAFARASVQYPGQLLKVDLTDLQAAKQKSPSLNHLLARYSDCLVAQLFQSVVCNAAHPLEKRTARWLLSAIERTGSAKVPWTHEQLASMLGVGRSYMSRVLFKLRADGIVETRRGEIFVRDAAKLKERCCPCHDAVSQHFETVLQGVYPNLEEVNGRRAAAI